MRVAILAQFPAHLLPLENPIPAPGGHYATWLPQLANAYGADEYNDLDLHWIALSDRIEQPVRCHWKNQAFHILPTARSKRASTLFRQDRARLDKVLDEINPQLVHGWGTEDVYGLAAVLSGYPSLISMQGILSYYIFKSRMHPREYLQAVLELIVLRRAHRLSTESDWGRQIVLKRAPKASVSLVEYGVQDHFLVTKWNPDPAHPAAVFVGSISPRKGIQDAIQAFRSPALQSKELWVIGGSAEDWQATFKSAVPPNVKWLGRKTSHETAEILSRAWCLVLPTRADTSPNVVKEARVIGLPVITTPEGGQTQYVKEGRAGWLVKPGAVAALTRHLIEVLGSLEHARDVGARDHELHRHLLNPARTAEGFARLYRETKS